MAISLKKNGGINLDKGLKNVIFTMTWDSAADVDIQATAVTNERAGEDEDFVFYGNLEHPSGAIKHSGDIKNGSKLPGKIDKEYIKISLTDVPDNKDEIILTASINNAIARGQHFGKIGQVEARLIDADTQEVLAVFDLDEDLVGESVAKLATLKRVGSIWRYERKVVPVDSLETFLLSVGLEVE